MGNITGVVVLDGFQTELEFFLSVLHSIYVALNPPLFIDKVNELLYVITYLYSK